MFRVLTDMFLFKPLLIYWSAAGAKIPAIVLIVQAGLTTRDVRLLGPCFKTGRTKLFSHRNAKANGVRTSITTDIHT